MQMYEIIPNYLCLRGKIQNGRAPIQYFCSGNILIWNLFMTSILMWVRSLKCLYTNIMFGVAFPLDFNVNKISKNGNLCLVLTFWRLLKGKWVGWDNFFGTKTSFFLKSWNEGLVADLNVLSALKGDLRHINWLTRTFWWPFTSLLSTKSLVMGQTMFEFQYSIVRSQK